LCDDQETMASVATTLSLIRSSLAASKAGSKYCETPRYEVSRSTRNRIKKNSIALASSTEDKDKAMLFCRSQATALRNDRAVAEEASTASRLISSEQP